jgi:hypothetical protein
MNPDEITRLNEDLAELDKELIEVNGRWMLPSQCYRVSNNLPHVLYNINCPDALKRKIQAIISKYDRPDESRSQKRRDHTDPA